MANRKGSTAGKLSQFVIDSQNPSCSTMAIHVPRSTNQEAGDVDNDIGAGKTRAKNWTEGERIALATAVHDRYKILFGMLDNNVSNKDKSKAWNEVVAEVNAASPYVRTLEQVKEKYKGIKSKAKESAAKYSKVIRKTGGGEPEELPDMDDEVTNIVLSTMPFASFAGIKGGVDSSDPNSQVNKKVVSGPRLELVDHGINKRKPEDEMDTVVSDEDSSIIHSGQPNSATPKRKRRREMKSQTEILLERQVELFQQQLEQVSDISNGLKLLVDVGVERLKVQREQLELQRKMYKVKKRNLYYKLKYKYNIQQRAEYNQDSGSDSD